MNKQIIILSAIAALAAAPALAQSGPAWKVLGSNPNGATLAYDPASVTTSGTVVTVTIKVTGQVGASYTLPNGQTYQAASFVERMAIDCAASTYADLQNTGYDAQGQQLYSQSNVHGMQPIGDVPAPSAMKTVLCH